MFGPGVSAADRYWEARRAAALSVSKVKTGVWEDFVEAMEKDLRFVSGKFWQMMQQLRKGKHFLAQAVFRPGGVLLTRTGDIVNRWKKQFEEFLNPTNASSVEEAASEDSGEASPISLAEVSEVVKKLLCSKVHG